MSKRLIRFLWLSLCCLSIIACQPSQSASSNHHVNANDYDAFWIWGDIKSAPYLAKAKDIYILQGEVRVDKKTRQSTLIPQGTGILKLPHQKVWLVFRNHHLNWQAHELDQILKRVRQWENSGNDIQGIQIDFDARTRNLNEYALFLQKLRKQLPKQYQLSITSLMDWTNIQNQNTLRLFRENIDEMVIQTYQGSTTIANYQQYLKKVSALKLPYKIGLVQHGEWNPNLNFKADSNFKGYVVFLLRN
ncbi:DUF3142 domain-containing protein [Acinetobacter wuhouensis]|uniref:DUF3142 domain-containing protein n=1 Tax=Acinetobacter wuhouensis TaxID=1879050 RepID=UPI00102387BF|nr:DUF3142 domain-containing protein [Acinetobacter wuhouensis]RZG64337.1 DUF3142 domain-containing protein [Acinetobacter wuhouensis]